MKTYAADLEKALRLQTEIEQEIKLAHVAKILSGSDEMDEHLETLAIQFAKLDILIQYMDKEVLDCSVSVDTEGWTL